jgi:Protein of unknown function (DUF3800)
MDRLSPPLGGSTYLVYVDDSGNESFRLYTAIFISASEWRTTLSRWLEWRRSLEARFEIPVLYEIHSAKFFAGRGRPSINVRQLVNTDRTLRRAIGREALDLVADIRPGIVTVARDGGSVGATYAGLVQCVEQELLERDAVGIVVLNGQDEDSRYWQAHRDLPLGERRVVEDPWTQPSHASQLIQMADIVAYAAHQQVSTSGRRSMAHWYEQAIAPLVRHTAADRGIVHLEMTNAPTVRPRRS